MKPMQTINYNTVRLRPQTMQFFIDNLLLLALTLCGYGYAGIEKMPLSSLFLWLSVLLSLVLAYRFVYLKRMAYLITGEQLIYEHGVFVRSNEYIELYRVVDFGERSGLLQQLVGLKNVSVYSGDRTTPRLDIIGVDIHKEVVPFIRERVAQNKRKNGIYEITNR